MGCLLSPVDKIDCTHFEKIPTGKLVKVKNLVKFGDHLLIETDKGRLYTNHRGLAGNNGFLPSGENCGWEKPLLQALVALGKISQSEMTKHMTITTKRAKERDKAYDAKWIKETFEKHGLKLTKAQMGKLGLVEKDDSNQSRT